MTADEMIRLYGDQAYYKGVGMVLTALQTGDVATSREMGPVNLELMRRGYHRKQEAGKPVPDSRPWTGAR